MKKSMLCGLLTAMVMLLTSCNKDENDGGTPYVKISPTTDAIAFSANGSETYTYEIETNQPVWLATSDQDWCVVTMDAYNNKFTVTAVPNGASTAPTPAIITVSAGSENTLTITATQAAMTDYEVYVTGYYETEDSKHIGCYWKDNVLKKLSLPDGSIRSDCSSITVSGGSIYMAGEYDGTACYWKDDTRVDLEALLPEFKLDSYGEVNSIAVDENKVYVCATNCYWIDNSIKEFPAEFMGNAVAVSNGKPYYVGLLEIELGGGTYRSKFAYNWKGTGSGGATRLNTPSISGDAEATCAFISNGSYYAGGYYTYIDKFLPCYWKDGECTTLDFPEGMTVNNLGGICVVGSTVHVVGTGLNDNGTVAYYWENNTRKELELPANAYNVEVTGITVASGKVCIAGHYQDETNRPRACYWINGKRTDIPKGTKENAYTTGIALVVK